MYDTLNLWHGGACMEIAPLLSRVAEHQRGDSYYITGDLQNLNVVLTNTGASVKGSLAKWFLNDNMKTLTRSDTQRAFEKLSDILKIDMNKAKVKRLDIATNFLMKYPPSVYYPMLGNSKHYQRNEKNTSLYYEGGNKTKLLYDKIAEVKFRGLPIHDVLLNQNYLRYELRFMHRIGQQFNTAELTAEKLFEEEFYINVVDRWATEYKNINKLKKMAIKENVILEPKDIMNQLTLFAISQMGGLNNMLDFVDEMRKKGQLKRPEYASRTKTMLKELCQLENLTEHSELITELDSKIKAVQSYYR